MLNDFCVTITGLYNRCFPPKFTSTLGQYIYVGGRGGGDQMT